MRSQAVENFVQFFENFNLEDDRVFNRVYADKVVFVDPWHRVEGNQELYLYFEKMMGRVQNSKFVIKEVVESEAAAVVMWTMRFTHKSMNGNQPIEVEGATHLTFDENGRVTLHRDYFDSTEMLYKHIPVVGSLVKMIEKKV